ncbi:GNAT family N-acetyltransferase [Lysobacter panacisoli]|uniref:GNAT family N-acetyltransferase n=1 Tax=Lysobacter panacisoli TaxID=1255263 RepID=A0ABP9LRS1_9GAMM|nr:GNAT family N-acetyltransferase [Lysobacter panacisoli]
MSVRTRPLRRDDWPHLQALFGERGACGGCWCMWWRVPTGGKAWEAAKGDHNRESFRRLVERGAATGVLAFVGDEAVGWCAIGPRSDFPRLAHSRALQRDWNARTWSLNCLFVPTRWRSHGIARLLVAAAVALARRKGAGEIEAYPQSVAEGERQAAAFVWTGVPALFVPHGFQRQTPRGRGRGLYLLRLG